VLPDRGLEAFMGPDTPDYDPENVEMRLDAAILKFRRYRSSANEQRDAVRDLADVLEYMREKVRSILTTRDDKDLFEIANQFGIRHHNKNQRTDYDREIWLPWMFHFYLATIHAVLALLKKSEGQSSFGNEDLPF